MDVADQEIARARAALELYEHRLLSAPPQSNVSTDDRSEEEAEHEWFAEAAEVVESTMHVVDGAVAAAEALVEAQAAAASAKAERDAAYATARWVRASASASANKQRAGLTDEAETDNTAVEQVESAEEPEWLTEAAEAAEAHAQEMLQASAAAVGNWARSDSKATEGASTAALAAEAALARAASKWVRAGAGAARIAAQAEAEEARAALAEAEASLARMRQLGEEAAAEEPEWLTAAAAAVTLAKRVSSQSVGVPLFETAATADGTDASPHQSEGGMSSPLPESNTADLLKRLGLVTGDAATPTCLSTVASAAPAGSTSTPAARMKPAAGDATPGSARAARVANLAAAVLSSTKGQGLPEGGQKGRLEATHNSVTQKAPTAHACVTETGRKQTQQEAEVAMERIEDDVSADAKAAIAIPPSTTAVATPAIPAGSTAVAAPAHVIHIPVGAAEEPPQGEDGHGAGVGSEGRNFFSAMRTTRRALQELSGLSAADVSEGLVELSRGYVGSMQVCFMNFHMLPASVPTFVLVRSHFLRHATLRSPSNVPPMFAMDLLYHSRWILAPPIN